MLTGQELLAKVKEMGDAPKTELATACGYVSKKKDGSDRVNFTAFYEALLNAKGIDLGSGGKGVGKGGRKLSYTAKVQFNGNLLVGKAYTALLDLEPGDEFEIKLGRKQIRLIPIGAAEEHASHSSVTDEEGRETHASKGWLLRTLLSRRPPVLLKRLAWPPSIYAYCCKPELRFDQLEHGRQATDSRWLFYRSMEIRLLVLALLTIAIRLFVRKI